MQIRPYLAFKGNCQEAVDLYSRAFNTKASEIMRFSDIPKNPNNPMSIPESKMNQIVQATIPFGSNFIRLSDSFGDMNEAPTDRIAIAVECSTDEVKNAFAVLSEEGTVRMPLQQTFFSPCYGIVIDKFGVMWNLAGMAENR